MHLLRTIIVQRIFSISLLLITLNFSLNTINDLYPYGQHVGTDEIESFSEIILEEIWGFSDAIQDTEENDQESSTAVPQLVWHPASDHDYRLGALALCCIDMFVEMSAHYNSQHPDCENPPPQLVG